MTAAKPDLKARLLSPRVETDEVEIPGIGTVKVRGLSRGEVFAVQKVAKGTGDMECKILARALIDPEMTEDEVRQWQDASPAGELERVSDRVNQLSGLSEGAEKSGLPGADDDD